MISELIRNDAALMSLSNSPIPGCLGASIGEQLSDPRLSAEATIERLGC
jgi:hypothetical protein